MTASLPMYETPCMRPAIDRLWNSIRDQYKSGPETLDRSTDPHKTWLDPDLVLSQTCGLPFRTELLDKVQLIGTPDYGVPDCPPGYYMSYLVARDADPRTTLAAFDGARLARNDMRSQSGWAAVVTHLKDSAQNGAFCWGDVLDTGGHQNSMRAVRDGKADLAGIDAVTWSLLERDTDATEGLRIIASTRPTPGLPLITGPTQDASALRVAVEHAICKLTPEDRALLRLRGLVQIPSTAYLAVPTPR